MAGRGIARVTGGTGAAAGQPVTLDNCADEPIHLPGHIQPHGALLLFDQSCLLTGWSANAPAMLGLAPSMGAPLAALGVPPAVAQLVAACRDEIADGEAAPMTVAATLGGLQFDCIVHAHQGRVLLECEPCVPRAAHVVGTAPAAHSAIDRLKRQKSVATLLQIAVAEVRAMTGFDRVMAYRFRPDDSGEVVAESCLATLTPYLGQRYPASDIPAQARRLYILNTLRLIVDVGYRPVAVLGRPGDAPLDMSYSVLRSISPIHIEYLHNMGVRASMSVSIVVNGQLWGLITCHHGVPRQVPYAIRKACDTLAHVLAAAAQSLETSLHLRRSAQAASVRARVIDTLGGAHDTLQALFAHAADLCLCFDANAMVFAHNGELLCHGDVPAQVAAAILDTLPAQGDDIVHRASLAQWPEGVHAALGKWVGLLGLCFDKANGGWILALRVEQVETVRWGGRPDKLRSAGPLGERLTPRGSFDEWRETVSGHCEPWDRIGVANAGQLLAKIHVLGASELNRRATHDGLTGLPNRALLLERTGSALKRSLRLHFDVALLYVDLDGFKQVNDSHGHGAGDYVLEAVAQRLLGEVRSGDTVARLAGDEFVVLCKQLDNPAELAALAGLAQRINAALREPISFEGARLALSASIGIAIGHGASHTATDLLRHADAALYAAKRDGRDNWRFFNLDMHAQAQQRLRILNGLLVALERAELQVRFQPIVVADSGRIVGAELLLRWFPPEGEVAPAVFIPIAEMTRSIGPIGLWVFAQACRAEVAWRARWGDEAPYVSVNLSVRQLDEESLPDDFGSELARSGAAPGRIVLEVTETALMANVEANLRVLRRLAALGLRVAVDDFGTGYSSLAQLTRLPVDTLKIDRAFITGVDQGAESRTVVRAVIGLGHALGLTLVAEGVETAAEQRELCAYGCDFIQGYYFHRPMTEAALLATVERERRLGSAGATAPLHFLIYVSHAVASLSAQEIGQLIAASRIFNQSVAVTGCLVYHDGCFMQLLEGTRAVVLALYDKIARDARHRDVTLVIEAPAPRRVFADWGMILRDLSAGAGEPDFADWQRRSIGFMELAQDARTCYAFITGYSPSYC